MSDNLRDVSLKLGVYIHSKSGNRYRLLISNAKSSEDQSQQVVYQALYGDFEYWIRPQSMWCETVEVNDQQVPRFVKVGD